jgi:hypothetical protein
LLAFAGTGAFYFITTAAPSCPLSDLLPGLDDHGFLLVLRGCIIHVLLADVRCAPTLVPAYVMRPSSGQGADYIVVDPADDLVQIR